MASALKLNLNEPVISGKSIINGFGYIESKNGVIDFSIIRNLIMNGDHDGKVLYVIRNCIPQAWTTIINNNFNTMIAQRGSHRNNDGFVAVQQIGASQFAKNGDMYIHESQKAYHDIHNLLHTIPHSVFNKLFLEDFLLENFLQHKIHFGPSRYKNGFACVATFRSWLDNGLMSLMPHEDKAQLAYAAKDDFEISQAQIVVAHNLCIKSTGQGGELTVWNIQPDDDCRKQFGVLETGYPYPPQYLSHINKFEISLNAGDMYFMNGCFIHGVKNLTNGSRITAGRFIGYIADNKVVYWT